MEIFRILKIDDEYSVKHYPLDECDLICGPKHRTSPVVPLPQ
jgi:hypothetical protein